METLGYQLIMPKNLPRHQHFEFYPYSWENLIFSRNAKFRFRNQHCTLGIAREHCGSSLFPSNIPWHMIWEWMWTAHGWNHLTKKPMYWPTSKCVWSDKWHGQSMRCSNWEQWPRKAHKLHSWFTLIFIPFNMSKVLSVCFKVPYLPPPWGVYLTSFHLKFE